MTENILKEKKKAIKHDGDQSMQVVTFLIGTEEFAAEISAVKEILRLPNLAPIPKSPFYLRGIANIRGTILPVIDANKRLKKDARPDTEKTRVLVLQLNNEMFGLTVDEVREVKTFLLKDISEPPAMVRGIDRFFLSGVIKTEKDQQLIMLLNLAEVLSVEMHKSENLAMESGRVTEPEAARGERVEEEQLVSFYLGEEEFAFAIAGVKEILKLSEITVVPNVPDFVLGIQPVRNAILPVIDMRRIVKIRPYEEEIAEFSGLLLKTHREWWTSLQKKFSARDVKSLTNAGKKAGLAGALASRRRDLMVQKIDEWLAPALAALTHELDQLVLLLNSDPERAGQRFADEMAKKQEAFLELLQEIENRLLRVFRLERKILIVESDGTSFGLLVDRVNEVLRVDRGFIDTTPAIMNSYGKEITGVAKLDDGARLILMLDENSLIERADLETISRIHQEESDRLAEKEVVSENVQQYVVFTIFREEFGISIDRIQEIFRINEITPVPKAPDYVRGVANMRGSIVPVIDIRQRFALPDAIAEFKEFLFTLQSACGKCLEEESDKPGKNAADIIAEMSGLFAGFQPVLESIQMRVEELKNLFMELQDSVSAQSAEGGFAFWKEKVTDFRGKLAELKKIPVQELLKNCKMLVVASADLVIGLLVDDVEEVVAIPAERIEKAPSLVKAEVDTGYLKGIAKLSGGERIILLLDVDEVLSKRQISGLRRLQDVTCPEDSKKTKTPQKKTAEDRPEKKPETVVPARRRLKIAE